MKKNIIKTVTIILLMVTISTFVTKVVMADTISGSTAKDAISGGTSKDTISGEVPNNNIFTLSNPLKVDSIGGLIQALIEIFTYIAILFAVIMFIYVGFQYVYNASKGNASEISKLHGQLMWLIVGVAIVIAARVIVQVVINTLQATNVVSPGVINSANKAIKGN